MKKLNKTTKAKLKTVTIVMACAMLVVAGVTGTLAYQNFLANVRAEGAAEFVLDNCDKYTDKKKTEEWLECKVNAL